SATQPMANTCINIRTNMHLYLVLYIFIFMGYMKMIFDVVPRPIFVPSLNRKLGKHILEISTLIDLSLGLFW
ncbi:hypothetical protein ACJX0J_037468, partial [Zea mays]